MDDSSTAAADRFFRSYHGHSIAPNLDTLFAYLNALHSFNDRFRKKGHGDLFLSDDFMALKSLRNLFHHETEFVHRIKFIPAQDLPPMSVELLVVCLAERSLVERAIEREKAEQRERIAGAFRWYGSVVDIQPCIFNASVDVYEACLSAGLEPSSNEFEEFDESYRYETANGHDHKVRGLIACRAGDINTVLSAVFDGR